MRARQTHTSAKKTAAFRVLRPYDYRLTKSALIEQVVSYARLLDLLDGGSLARSAADILLPNALSWFCLGGSSLLLAVGLHYKVRL